MQKEIPTATNPENHVIPENAIIIDVDMSNFGAEVIEKSLEIPVIVDFWAPWCEPCKTLGPLLEKIIIEAGGAIRMAKINIDENQEIAQQMQIRSVPTVVAFVGGRPVDAFNGAKPESEIREFLAKIAPDLGPSEIEQMLSAAEQQYDQENYQDAGGLYSQALQMDAENPTAIAGLVMSLIKLNDLENAGHILSGLDEPLKNKPAITAASAALDTALKISELGDTDTLTAALEKNDQDHRSRFDLALALWAKGEQDEAADHLLFIIAADKEWQDDGARKQLVKFFEMAGPMDPFTLRARRKLSSLLFA